jgi:copper chaperone CopZ
MKSFSVYRLLQQRAIKNTADDSQHHIAKAHLFCQTQSCHFAMRTKTAIISIEALSAEAVPNLTQAFKAIPGVHGIDFSLERSVAVVEFDPNQSNVDDFLRAVLKAGYKPA